MPGPCSVCWKGAPALPERFNDYLDQVAQVIRWRRARPFALRELRTHLLEQKDCFMAEGMSEQEAEETALRDIGDPSLVGEELDTVHRPREQWLLLGVVVVLACIAVFLRFYLTIGYEYEMPHPMKTAAALVVGLAAMAALYFLDYRVLMRHGEKIYISAILLGFLTWQFGPHVNNAAWYTRHIVLLYPVVYAVWLNTCRNKGWKGVFLAIFGGIPLAMIACMAPYVTGLLLLLIVGFVLLLATAGMDWFGVGRPAGFFASAAAAVVVAVPAAGKMLSSASFARRVEFMLHPENDPLGYGYQAMSVRDMLSGAQWQGRTTAVSLYGNYSYEYVVPEWNADFFLTTIACKLGWLIFLVVVGVMLVLFTVLLVRACRGRNAFGRLLAVSAILPMLLQTAGAVIQNLGYVFTSVPIPLFSGNLIMMLTLAQVALALSVFRQEKLPEEQGSVERRRWKLVLITE